MSQSPDHSRLAGSAGFIMLLGGLSAVSALSMDVMLPAVGEIARVMDHPEQDGGYIISVYFVAFAFGQLLWGLLSDAYGRRPMLLISIAGFGLASLGCMLAESFETIIFFRVVQGLMAGPTPIARAMARDIGSTGVESARLLSILLVVTVMAPILAPVIGSAMLIMFDWRATFAVIVLFCAVLLILTAKYGVETNDYRRPERLRLSFIFGSLKELSRQPNFVTGAALSAFIFGGYGALLSNGSIVVEAAYGIDPVSFGVLFAFAALFVMAGSLGLRQAIPRLGMRKMALVAIAVAAIATLGQLIMTLMTPSLNLFWGSVCLYLFAVGIGFPFGQALAVERAKHISGFAASLVGSMFVTAAAAGGMLGAELFDGSHRSISIVMVVSGTLAVAAGLLGFKKCFDSEQSAN